MKISQVMPFAKNATLYNSSDTSNNNIKNSSVTKTMNRLSNVDTLGRSLVSFKSTNNMDLSTMSVSELQDLKKLYQSNQAQIDTAKKDAQANLDKIKAWNEDYEYKKQHNDAEAEINSNYKVRFWHPYKIKAIREKHYNKFYDKRSEIWSLESRKALDEQIVNSSPLNKTQIETLIKNIDAMIIQKQKLDEQQTRLDGIDDVNAAIGAMFNKEDGLNDRIAGYDYEKDQITKLFVEPMFESKRNHKVRVPSAVLLHGATGTGKTTFLNGIGTQCEDFVKVVDLSIDVDGDDFEEEIKRQLRSARERYFELDENQKPKQTRTILLINEAEKFLSMTPEEGRKLLGENILDSVDIELMENYGHNSDYINKFKTLLDTCSEVPKDMEDKNRGPLTIFMTSNYPHLIHPDLLSRDGKLPFIAINPARNENLEAVVKHYIKKASNLVEKIKEIENPGDVKSLIGISRKAKEKIKELIEKGEINKLSIDYEHIPYDKLPEKFNPSMKLGAFSNDRYRKIAEDAINLYLEDPTSSFYNQFTRLLLKENAEKKLPNGAVIPSGRDINPNRYKKFVTIYDLLAPAEPNEKEILIEQEKLGSLDEKAQARLNHIRLVEEFELKNLEEKEEQGILSDEEKIRLDELKFSSFEKPKDTAIEDDEE